MSTPSFDRRTLFAGIALFLFAFIFRLFGIGWGLSNDLHNTSLHPDEMVVYSNYAYRPNPFIPNNYNYPSFYPLVLRLAGDMVTTYGGYDSEVGLPPATSLEQQKQQFIKYAPHQRAVNVAGRVLSSIAGAGTAAVIFFLLLRFSGMIGALMGGGLMAIAPAFLVHSRFQTVDVTSTFFFWLSILYAAKLYLNQTEAKLDLRYAILAGVFAGLSTGTKYTGCIALASVFMALLLNKKPQWFLLFVYSFVACVVVFVITTPGVLLDSKEFLKSFTAELGHMQQGNDLEFVATPNGFIYQLGNLFTGIGPLAFIIGLIGLAYGAFKKRGWMWVVLPSVLIYYVIVGRSEVMFIRYGLPLVPAICVGYGYAIGGLIKRDKWRLIAVAAACVSFLGLESVAMAGFKPSPYWACFDPRFGGLYGAVKYTGYMMREDPRDQAARYVFAQTAKDPNAAIGIFRVPWYWTVSVIKDSMFLFTSPTEVNELINRLYLGTTKNPTITYVYALHPPQYAVLTNMETNPFDRIKDATQVPDEWADRYHDLNPVLQDTRANYQVIATFGDDAPAVADLLYIQPKAYVLKHK